MSQQPEPEAGRRAPGGTVDALDRHELRRRVVDRVIDAGGEVSMATVSDGMVLVRGRVGCRSEVAMLERELRDLPGVTQLDLRLGYDIDDIDEMGGMGDMDDAPTTPPTPTPTPPSPTPPSRTERGAP
ncbi:hypothetical protein [Catenulispora subtropica]|uniref:BON domain-containing protein n=1 Tax=Catenulispora subtropica TaxID=450798 RepID=A0ABN2TGP1_9ACTN